MPFFKRKVKSVKSESEGSDDSSSSDYPPVVSGSRGQARYPSNVPQKREQSASPAMSHTNIKKQKKSDPKTDKEFSVWDVPANPTQGEGAFSPSHVSSRSSRSSTPGFSQNARRNPAPAGGNAYYMGQQRATRGVGWSDDSDDGDDGDDGYVAKRAPSPKIKRVKRSPSPDPDRSPSPVPNGKKQIKRKMWW